MDFSFSILSHQNLRVLNYPVSEGEIKIVLSRMAPLKAPGPMDFPRAFTSWEIMGPSVVEFIKHAFDQGCFSDNMNETMITLIAKKESPKTMSQFLPVALYNIVVKSITKVIANRLKPLMNQLVRACQSSFIPGRQSAVNLVIVQEAIHSMKKKEG